MTPETVLACSPDELRADGVSRQKDRYLRALAEAVAAGTLDLDALAAHDDATARAELIALPGIGRWTADVYLLACLGRPDLWPVGDRALQVAVAEALDRAEVPDPVALEALGERWRPHRSSAARVLWHGYLGRRGRVETPTTSWTTCPERTGDQIGRPPDRSDHRFGIYGSRRTRGVPSVTVMVAGTPRRSMASWSPRGPLELDHPPLLGAGEDRQLEAIWSVVDGPRRRRRWRRRSRRGGGPWVMAVGRL